MTNYKLVPSLRFKAYLRCHFSRQVQDFKRSKSSIFQFLIFNLLIFQFLIGHSQDIHFSQYTTSPLHLNPALAGAFDGECRLTAIERSQWYTVTVPYQTFGASVDVAQIKKLKNVGLGLSFYNDKTGDSRFSTFCMNLSLSYHLKLNADSTHILSFGLQSGVTQRKFDYSNLSFNSQYNGYYYDPALASQELFTRYTRVYPNLNAGIHYNMMLSEKLKVTSGISVYNINKPQQSFYNNNAIKLDQRFNIHASLAYSINQHISVLPSILWMSQGAYKELDIGGYVKYALVNMPYMYRAIYVGVWTRAKDAGFVAVGMDYDNISVGLSYDINYSNLTPASNAHGGFEVSLIYILKRQLTNKNKKRICPEII